MEEEISDKEVEELLGQLAQCHEACIQSLIYAVKEGGDLAEYEMIRNLWDCVEITDAAESFFLRESNYGGDILDLCSEICVDTAESCDIFKANKVLQSCAAICRNCARACDDIISQTEEESVEQ